MTASRLDPKRVADLGDIQTKAAETGGIPNDKTGRGAFGEISEEGHRNKTTKQIP